MPLPCRHFRPASITDHFEESIMTGTRAMSGSAAIRFRKRTIAASRVEHALVHVDVDDLRAALDLLARDVERAGVVARPRSGWRNFAEPVTLVRSPTLTNRLSGPMLSGSRPAQPAARLEHRRPARRQAGDRVARSRAMCVRRGAAAAADDVDEAARGELARPGRPSRRRSRRTRRTRSAGRRSGRRRRRRRRCATVPRRTAAAASRRARS